MKKLITIRIEEEEFDQYKSKANLFTHGNVSALARVAMKMFKPKEGTVIDAKGTSNPSPVVKAKKK